MLATQRLFHSHLPLSADLGLFRQSCGFLRVSPSITIMTGLSGHKDIIPDGPSSVPAVSVSTECQSWLGVTDLAGLLPFALFSFFLPEV